MKSFATTAAILSLCSKHVLALPGRSYQSKELASKSYQDSITIEGLLTHAKKWQEFASSTNGSRSFESEGYKLSANYVYDLAKQSGYKVTRQTVEFPRSKIHSQELNIDGQVFGPGEVLALTYSPFTPKEGITAGLAIVLDVPNTFLGSGCHRDDYDGLDVRRGIVFMSALWETSVPNLSTTVVRRTPWYCREAPGFEARTPSGTAVFLGTMPFRWYSSSGQCSTLGTARVPRCRVARIYVNK